MKGLSNSTGNTTVVNNYFGSGGMNMGTSLMGGMQQNPLMQMMQMMTGALGGGQCQPFGDMGMSGLMGSGMNGMGGCDSMMGNGMSGFSPMMGNNVGNFLGSNSMNGMQQNPMMQMMQMMMQMMMMQMMMQMMGGGNPSMMAGMMAGMGAGMGMDGMNGMNGGYGSGGYSLPGYGNGSYANAGSYGNGSYANAGSYGNGSYANAGTSAGSTNSSTYVSGADSKVNTPWYSQFDSSHVPDAGSDACYRASKVMAEAGGGSVLNVGDRIQVATGENANGKISVNKEKAQEGLNRINSQLSNGKPVVVGVSYKDADYNADKVTDHFVVITGKGTDENGKTYYTFNDPGTKNEAYGKDTNKSNRFYVDDSGKLYRNGTSGGGGMTSKDYEVSMVR